MILFTKHIHCKRCTERFAGTFSSFEQGKVKVKQVFVEMLFFFSQYFWS